MIRKLPDILTEWEQRELLDCFNLRYITPHRNKTMVELVLRTGLRLSEMNNLKWINVDLMIGEIKVVEGKGAKDRILYIKDDMVETLTAWKKRQFKEWGKTEYVFTTRTLNKWDGKAVRKMIATYTSKAGIDKHITMHSLRHTFATNLLNQTDNIRIVQEALGHEDIRTTQIYTHISNNSLREAMFLL